MCTCFDRNRSTSDATMTRTGEKRKRTVEDQLERLEKQRLGANLRERRRTTVMNTAFGQLNQKLPKMPGEKLDKFTSLRMAMAYIEFLSLVSTS